MTQRLYPYAISVIMSLLLILPGTAAAETLRLHVTTSFTGSGFAEVLIPDFEKRSGIQVKVIAAGTGKAIRLASEGNSDLLWVHSPEAEKKFVASGYGMKRIPTMFNDFVIVGPKDNPAAIQNNDKAASALKRIEQGKHLFVSRADDSGTHQRELSLWKSAGISPFGLWYFEAGMGMKKALYKAAELGAYTIVDRGTWLKHKNKLELAVMLEGNEELRNHYSLIPLNPAKLPSVNTKTSKQFINYVLSRHGKDIITNYAIDGEKLFKLYN